jgi:hypothetical protein
MFVRLTAFLLILTNCSFAQTEGLPSPTKFDKFIDLSKVTWAAYVNDTLSFDNYNLSDELYKRFQKDEIKISDPLSRDSLMAGNKIIYLTKKDLELKSFAPGNYGNSKPTNRVDSNSGLLGVEQILYIVDGKLYSYIPWVSPRISVYTSRDQFIGTSEYFSSGINAKYNFKPSKRDDIKFIKSTKRKIVIDSIPRADMLKQLYGINMLEALWNDMMNDKNEIIDVGNGQKTSLKNLKYNLPTSMSIPIYDSLGNVMGTRNNNVPATPLLFQQIEITQSWFYDHTKNVVLNYIPDATLYVRRNGELVPYIKIIFK